MFEPSATQVRLELITHEPGQRSIALTEMREECVSVLLDRLVEQCLLGPVTRVALLRRDEGGESVRLRTRMDSEHPPDWSAPMSRAQWPIGASRYRLCPCQCERRSRKVGRLASTHRCHSSSSRRPADVETLDDGVDFERSDIAYPNGCHVAADDRTLAEAGVQFSSTIS